MARKQEQTERQPRAAIYCRVSTTMQEDNYSLPTQEAASRQHAASLGYEVAEMYQDIHSGYELWERKGLTAMREAARTGAYDAIIAYEPDRLSRRQVHSAVLIDECERHGVELLFVIGQHDKTALGEFLANVRTFAAEMEREKFRERSQRGIMARLQSGKLRPSNRPLYGYQWADEDKGRFLIDEEKAAIVRRLFNGVVSGKTLRGLAEMLNDEGVPTANGGAAWNHVVIRTMLLHPGYMGVAKANTTARTKARGKQIRTPRPEADHITLPDGTIPALVTPDVFAAVQDRLARNQAEATRNNQHPEAFLLRSGFVVCGYCGKPIRTTWVKDCPKQAARGYYASDPGRLQHQDCPAFAMSAKKLDAAVWAKVEALIVQPEIVAAEVERLRRDDPTLDDIATVERVLNEIVKKQANLSRSLALIDDADASAPLINELKALGERKRELQSERDTLLTRQASWQASQDQLSTVQEWLGTVTENVRTLAYQEKRDLLAALDVQVKLYRKDHRPRYEITASLPLDAPIASDLVVPRNTLSSRAGTSPS